MRTYTKLQIAIILFMSVISLFFVSGCGKAINGDVSGGCADNPAPAGSAIVAPTGLGAPSTTGNSCYPNLQFAVNDSDGNPMNGVCVEIYTSANIALHSGAPDCSTVRNYPQTAIVTRTNSYGLVLVEMWTEPTEAGKTHFVQVLSGAASAIATTEGAAD